MEHHAPETWLPARRFAQRILRPIESFLHVQAASGIVLLLAAVVALIWANSPWSDSYGHLWHTPLTIGIGRFVSSQSLHFWINDGLMTVFFLIVGLEIRREIHEGELSDLRRAALPIVAAAGGMLVPAFIYLALNRTPEVSRGWGIPTATDIAFAVGVLALLGKRVPPALRVLLLALAIIDDIGAILIIAFFYSEGVSFQGLLIAGAGTAGIVLFQRVGVRSALAYVIPGGVVWLGMLRSGVHPTIAGVIVGMMTPARAWFGREGFLEVVGRVVEEVRERGHRGKHEERAAHAERDAFDSLKRVKLAEREALPPVVRVQHALHGWVAFGVMPLFALANAGVYVRGLSLTEAHSETVLLGIVFGLVLGKPVGIVLASFIATRVGLCRLPRGVDWKGVTVVGCVAGIGFTVAIFVTGLAFEDAKLLTVAKVAVLAASVVAALAGLLVGRFMLSPRPSPEAAITLEQAEGSTEI
jgi:NhaA family Na+:H+ antiporter